MLRISPLKGPQLPCCEVVSKMSRTSGFVSYVGLPAAESEGWLIISKYQVILLVSFNDLSKLIREMHINRHYEATLHTYAMNVHTRNVWDFAGDGYVHRLILNVPEGLEAASVTPYASTMDANTEPPATLSSAVKVVEVSDSRQQLSVRLHTAPLTSQQEEVIVNRKLEEAAQHYNQLLTWQLATQREHYELQLARLQSFLSATVEQNAWEKNIMASLNSERAKILKQIEVAKKRRDNVKRELEVTEELRKSMTRNLEDFEVSREKSDAEFQDEKTRHERCVNELQKEIDKIMLMLEESTTGSSSSSV